MKEILKTILIIGSGPAALMAADVASAAGYKVSVYEKRKGPGRKLLIAGSSGLNITNSLPLPQFEQQYAGLAQRTSAMLAGFSPQAWIEFIENLGLKTFCGTSGRYFLEEMKASKFLKAWIHCLTERGVLFFYDQELSDFSITQNLDSKNQKVRVSFSGGLQSEGDALCLALGGGSYEPQEIPLRWPPIFQTKGIGFSPFLPANVGYQVEWSEAFLKEAEGLPLKNIQFTSSRGSRKGDLIITKYGLEGTPVYAFGVAGEITLDLKPDLTESQILAKCQSVKENLSPLRRVSRHLHLCPASLALLYHQTSKPVLSDLGLLVKRIKAFPLLFKGTQSLEESISSKGGVHLEELDEQYMLRKFPGVFLAGEMLNWDAPTGGFLIQASVSQGYAAGQGMLRHLSA